MDLPWLSVLFAAVIQEIALHSIGKFIAEFFEALPYIPHCLGLTLIRLHMFIRLYDIPSLKSDSHPSSRTP